MLPSSILQLFFIFFINKYYILAFLSNIFEHTTSFLSSLSSIFTMIPILSRIIFHGSQSILFNLERNRFLMGVWLNVQSTWRASTLKQQTLAFALFFKFESGFVTKRWSSTQKQTCHISKILKMRAIHRNMYLRWTCRSKCCEGKNKTVQESREWQYSDPSK